MGFCESGDKPLSFMSNIGPTYQTTHHNQGGKRADTRIRMDSYILTDTLFLVCFHRGNLCHAIKAALCLLLIYSFTILEW